MTNKSTMVLMVGGPGAGKSTVRQRLYPTLPVIDCDNIKGSHPEYDAKHPEKLHQWSQEQATREIMGLLLAGGSFVYDSTGTNLERLALYTNIAHASGMKVKAVYVACDVETAIARNANRERVVPEKTVREKHSKVNESWTVLKSMVDEFEVVEN